MCLTNRSRKIKSTRISWHQDILSNFKCFFVVWSEEIGTALKLGHSFTSVFTNVEHLKKQNTTSSTDVQRTASEDDNKALMIEIRFIMPEDMEDGQRVATAALTRLLNLKEIYQKSLENICVTFCLSRVLNLKELFTSRVYSTLLQKNTKIL